MSEKPESQKAKNDKNSRIKHKITFIVGILLILILLAIIAWYIDGALGNSTTLIAPSKPTLVAADQNDIRGYGNFGNASNIWTTTSKVSGGLPLVGNDVYDTMGLTISIGGLVDGWEFRIMASDIADSRLGSTNISLPTIKSQTIKVLSQPNPPYKTLISGGAVSWPYINSEPHSLWKGYGENVDYQLYSNMLNDSGQFTDFPLKSNNIFHVAQAELIKRSLGYGYDIVPSGDESTKYSVYSGCRYSGLPIGGPSDSVCTYYWIIQVPYGKTASFDVISSTSYGLTGSSEKRMHITINTPPMHANMTGSELTENGVTLFHYPNDPVSNFYFIDPANVSIIVT